MTLRYAHLAPEFKMKAVEVLDEAREAMFGGAKVLSFVRSRTGISQLVYHILINYFLIGNIYVAFRSNGNYLPER